MEAEGKGIPVKEIDERLMVSPTRQDSTTIIVVHSQEATPKVQNKIDEDEHINRLVQENNDDRKSVLSFGKRTDVDAEGHDGIKRVVPFDGPLKMAIQKYVGDYEGLWTVITRTRWRVPG